MKRMKRITAILISTLLLMTTGVLANGNIPEALTKYPENFTAAYRISVSIDDNSDIRSLIEEVADTDFNMGSVVASDFLNFLSAMFEYDSTVHVQADVSPDYKKIKLSMTNSNVFSSVVSSNLNYTVQSKAGLWADIDLTDETEPKIDITFLSPSSDKYRFANVGEYIKEEDLASFYETFNVEEFQKVKDEVSQLLFSNSKVEKTKDGYKLTMDNENFSVFVGEVVSCCTDEEAGLEGEMQSTLKNIKFLGEDGITANYSLKNGKISRAEVKTDISFNLSAISEAMGEEWPYKTSGIIDIKLNETVDFTKIGTTKVQFPTLNDENSISLNKIVEEEMSPDDSYEYTLVYPHSYISAESDVLPVVDGKYYVPFRRILEDGYYDTVSIAFDKGVITASSEYFPGFQTLEMTIGNDKVYLDGTEYVIGTVMLVDGVTYVSADLFTELFGWELIDITHSILDDFYYIGLYT